ncbi:hypothetical protein [uncultured Cutibacterium sp.]|uniref:hypothetical protein n=1 Tax=uncultured Cutibacterium sp. TaxID=1912223 RepID=UPI00280387B7|nr:hypothetical protein [uncultured Cutibacterium sp.]
MWLVEGFIYAGDVICLQTAGFCVGIPFFCGCVGLGDAFCHPNAYSHSDPDSAQAGCDEG